MEENKAFFVALGARIRAYRHEQDMTQVQYSARLDIDERHLRCIENGYSPPSLHVLLSVAKEAKVPVDQILKDIPNE